MTNTVQLDAIESFETEVLTDGEQENSYSQALKNLETTRHKTRLAIVINPGNTQLREEYWSLKGQVTRLLLDFKAWKQRQEERQAAVSEDKDR